MCMTVCKQQAVFNFVFEIVSVFVTVFKNYTKGILLSCGLDNSVRLVTICILFICFISICTGGGAV